MAELPRYRPLGVSIGSMPSVNFVQTGQAEARVYDQIGNSLDAISDFVYKRAVAEAEVAAVKYGAEIAPSAAELEAASKSGVTIDPDLPDGFTIFDQKARKTAVDVIQTNMEIAARNEINQLTIDAKDSDMSADEFQLNLNAIIDGYSTSLNQIDPVASVNLQAAIAPVANSKLTTHANAMADKAEKQQKVAVTFGVDGIINNVPDIIAAGNKIGDDGNVTSVNDFLNAERNRIAVLSYGVDDAAFAERQLAAFDKAVIEAKAGYVADWITKGDKPLEHLSQVRSGEIQDENIKALFDGMSLEEEAAAFKAARDAFSARDQLRVDNDAAAERNRKEQIDAIKTDLVDAKIAGDQESRRQLVDSLRLLDPDEYEKQMIEMVSGAGIDNAEAVNELDISSASGTLTEDQISLFVRENQITSATSTKYYGLLKSQRSANETAAMKIIRDFYGIPEPGRAGAVRAAKTDSAQKVVQAQLELQEVMKIDPDTNTIAWAKQYIKDLDEGVGVAVGQGVRLDVVREKRLNKTLKEFNLTSDDTEEAIALLAQQFDDGEITALEFAEYTSFIAKKGM